MHTLTCYVSPCGGRGSQICRHESTQLLHDFDLDWSIISREVPTAARPFLRPASGLAVPAAHMATVANGKGNNVPVNPAKRPAAACSNTAGAKRPVRPGTRTDRYVGLKTSKTATARAAAAAPERSISRRDTLDFGVHVVEGFACTPRMPPGELLVDSILSSTESRASTSSSSTKRKLIEYVMDGPPDAVSCLRQLFGPATELLGHMSPVNTTTIVGSNAVGIGMPKRAWCFGFVYPFKMLHRRQRKLLDIVGSRLGEECLVNTPPWLDLLLTGGFVYFDKGGALLRANALGMLKATAAGSLTLYGPYAAERAAGDFLRRSERLQPVTLETLAHAGFHRFGWVFKDERPGEAALSEAHEQGAFVYAHKDGTYYFYQLQLPGTRSLLPANFKLSSEMGQSLDRAIRQGAANARDTLAYAKETVRKRLDEERPSARDCFWLRLIASDSFSGEEAAGRGAAAQGGCAQDDTVRGGPQPRAR